MKKKKCKICHDLFKPFNTLQVVCGYQCAIIFAEAKESKRLEAFHKEMKREFRSNDIKLRKVTAQKAFNAYIRKRDEKLPCISCQKFHTGQYHAGHFKTTAARSDLKFNEDNCHKQCSRCNNHLSGNIGEYLPNLITKIGQERVDALMVHKVVKYTAKDYKSIEHEYKKRLKELED